MDFVPGAKFDGNWVEVKHEQFKAGLTHASSKLFAGGAKWSVATAGETASYPRALACAARAGLFAEPGGTVTLRDAADGKELLRTKLEPLAWDGAAAVSGRIIATTSTGRVVCLGAR